MTYWFPALGHWLMEGATEVRLRFGRRSGTSSHRCQTGRRALGCTLRLEALELRALLNSAPIAVADAYALTEDDVLIVGRQSDTAAGLINRWRFDETSGNRAADDVGGNDGTLFNWGVTETKWVDGRLGGALDFGDRNNYIRTESVTVLDHYTFAFWLRLDTTPELNPRIISPVGDEWVEQSSEFGRGIGFYYNHGQTSAQRSSRLRSASGSTTSSVSTRRIHLPAFIATDVRSPRITYQEA